MSDNNAVKWDGKGTPKNGMLINRAGVDLQDSEVVFIGIDSDKERWVIKTKSGGLISLPLGYLSYIKSDEEISNNKFLLQLADLLEEHGIFLVSQKISELSEYTKIVFQTKGVENMFPKLGRCHISPYDLRCLSGMGSKKANEVYHKFLSENKNSAVAHEENTLAAPYSFDGIITCVEANIQNSMTTLNQFTKYGDKL